MRDMSEQPVSPINESIGSDQQPPVGARGLRSRQEQIEDERASEHLGGEPTVRKLPRYGATPGQVQPDQPDPGQDMGGVSPLKPEGRTQPDAGAASTDTGHS